MTHVFSSRLWLQVLCREVLSNISNYHCMCVSGTDFCYVLCPSTHQLGSPGFALFAVLEGSIRCDHCLTILGPV